MPTFEWRSVAERREFLRLVCYLCSQAPPLTAEEIWLGVVTFDGALAAGSSPLEAFQAVTGKRAFPEIAAAPFEAPTKKPVVPEPTKYNAPIEPRRVVTGPPQSGQTICAVCGEEKEKYQRCQYCHQTRKKATTWICTGCGEPKGSPNAKCLNCGRGSKFRLPTPRCKVCSTEKTSNGARCMICGVTPTTPIESVELQKQIGEEIDSYMSRLHWGESDIAGNYPRST